MCSEIGASVITGIFDTAIPCRKTKKKKSKKQQHIVSWNAHYTNLCKNPKNMSTY